jgi:hypothetical protein
MVGLVMSLFSERLARAVAGSFNSEFALAFAVCDFRSH